MKQRKVQTKRVFSLLLAMVMLFGVLSTGMFTLGVSAATTNINDAGSSPTAGNIYEISDAAGLLKFRDWLFNKHAGVAATYKLTADITLNSGWTAGADAPSDETQLWNKAIQNGGQWFAGTFDGQGYTISGLYVNDASQDGIGMFAGLKANAVVKNLSLENSYFADTGAKTNDGIGAIAGDIQKAANVTIENVYVGNTVTVTKNGQNVGGLVGYFSSGGTGSLTIKNSVFAGTATSDNIRIGGILGYNPSTDVTVTIENCVNLGSISTSNADGAELGGIIGRNCESTGVPATLTNCVNLGTLTANGADGRYGELLGYTQVGAEFNNCVFANGLGREAGDYKLVGSGSTGIVGTPKYVVKADFETTLNSCAGADLEAFVTTDGNDIGWAIKTAVNYPNTSILSIQDCTPTSTNAIYKIEDASDLLKFRDLISTATRTDDYKTLTFILTNDINLNEGYTGGATAPTGDTWNAAVGNGGMWFGGTFDGQGYTISGLYVSDPSADGIGMFAGLKANAVVKNFALVNSYFADTGAKTNDGIGAIAGDIQKAANVTIENVYVGNTVTVTKNGQNVGGLVGYFSSGGTGSLTVKNSVFAGNVTSNDIRVGGILGYNSSVDSTITIENCVNLGSISTSNASESEVGGIVGRSDGDGTDGFTILNSCVNLGTLSVVDATTGRNGDLVGHVAAGLKLIDCYYTDGLGRIADSKEPKGVGSGCANVTGTAVYVAAADFEAAWGTVDWKALVLAGDGSLGAVLNDAFNKVSPIRVFVQMKNDGSSIRFIGLVNLEDTEFDSYSALGFNITMSYNGTSYPGKITTSTVYEQLTASGETVKAADLGGSYFYIVEITGLNGATLSDVDFAVSGIMVEAGTSAETVYGYCEYTVPQVTA